MLTVWAFIVALCILIAIHEYGHYRMAVACGVKVLRFSIGIGKPLLRWKVPHAETEFVIAALPLGGYVRMLDEREGDVPANELHRAFNRQPLRKRAAIVAAGPMANLLLAVLLYSLVNWIGVPEPKAIVAAPPAGSVAAEAGLQGGDTVVRMQVAGQSATSVTSFEDLRWGVTQAALDGRDITLEVLGRSGASTKDITLNLAALPKAELDQSMLKQIGITAPWTPAIIGEVAPDMPAQQAGLQEGDKVLRVNDLPIVDGAQLRAVIRDAAGEQSMQQLWQVERNGRVLSLNVLPMTVETAEGKIGRIGAYVGAAPEMITVRKGFVQGLADGAAKTYEISALSLKMMGRMLIGEASLKNLSGPLTIADYAGQSANQGWIQYLLFLALISVSLGVLNLLPVPVLDGGHLMYYLWEGITGHAVNGAWMERLQQLGIALLLVMMCIAFFNDITRIWG